MSLGWPTSADRRQDERDAHDNDMAEIRCADETRFAFDAADVIEQFRRLRESEDRA